MKITAERASPRRQAAAVETRTVQRAMRNAASASARTVGREKDGQRGLRESAENGHAERGGERGEPSAIHAAAKFPDGEPGERHPRDRHDGADMLGARGEVAAGFEDQRARPGGDARGAEIEEQMIRRDARNEDVQRHHPFEQLRQPLGIRVRRDPGAARTNG